MVLTIESSAMSGAGQAWPSAPWTQISCRPAVSGSARRSSAVWKTGVDETRVVVVAAGFPDGHEGSNVETGLGDGATDVQHDQAGPVAADEFLGAEELQAAVAGVLGSVVEVVVPHPEVPRSQHQ
jgi:hypothetical protein